MEAKNEGTRTEISLHGLSEEKKSLYKEAFFLWRLSLAKESSFFPRKVTAAEKKAWDTFMAAFLNAADAASIEAYARKPETFPKDSFKIIPAISHVGSSYRGKYGTREACVIRGKGNGHFFIDAPFAYALLYKVNAQFYDTWDPISVISFFPDFQKRRILVDQIQGCTTANRTHSRFEKGAKEKSRARMKFAKLPEEMLFEIVRTMAVNAGFSAVGLRKSRSNAWFVVSESKKPTVYDRVASSQGLKKPLFGSYCTIPIEKTIG